MNGMPELLCENQGKSRFATSDPICTNRLITLLCFVESTVAQLKWSTWKRLETEPPTLGAKAKN
jgi:hypothetical protein